MSGGKAALPIWVDYMKVALEGRPKIDFIVPRGLSWVKIDKTTGKRAQECTSPSNIRTEVFKKGTAPKELSPCPIQIDGGHTDSGDPYRDLYR